MFVSKLDWCADDNLNVALIDNTGSEVASFRDIHFDILIGTDIVYWPTIIKPLVKTLVSLFSTKPDLIFYICYIERHSNTHKELL